MVCLLCTEDHVSYGAAFFTVSVTYITRAYLGGLGVTISIKRHLNEFNSTSIKNPLFIPSPQWLGITGRDHPVVKEFTVRLGDTSIGTYSMPWAGL